MPDTTPRYRAHARRVEVYRTASPEPLASYWQGYRLGMVRSLVGDPTPQSEQDAAREARAEKAIRGGEMPIDDLARSCGYHDGQRWEDVGQHRGLLRLAIVAAGEGSVRGFSLTVLDPPIADPSVRQMLAGSRPIPATRHAELLDWIVAALPESE